MVGQSVLCQKDGVGHVFFIHHISKCSGPPHPILFDQSLKQQSCLSKNIVTALVLIKSGWRWLDFNLLIKPCHRSCYHNLSMTEIQMVNLVPRVLRLFGQRLVARRDSGVLEFYYRRISAVKQCKPLRGSQSKNLNFFQILNSPSW